MFLSTLVRQITEMILIDSPDDVGGYKVYKPAKVSTDTDGDGIPDRWERRHGLNPNNAQDGSEYSLLHKDLTNLEVYLNGLVDEITYQQNRGAMPSKDVFWLAMLKMVNFLKK